MALACVAGMMLSLMRGIYPFLATTQPVYQGPLVIEGWIQTHYLEHVSEADILAHYNTVIIVTEAYTNGNRWDSGRYKAEYIATGLKDRGFPAERLHVVFYEPLKRDRTYQSAIAVMKWLKENSMPPSSVDVLTVGSHARRSRLLFQKAFGNEVRVGVIALHDNEYDPKHWWRSSEGVREVPFESIAYLYAKFLFHP